MICVGRLNTQRPCYGPGGGKQMTFHSILFEKPEEGIKKETLKEPDFFVDLNFDQIIAAITAGKKEYNLKPFFYTPLHDINTINYRHEIMQDLENEVLFKNIKLFAQKMCKMRQHLSLVKKLEYKYHKEGWFLEAVEIYCDAVTSLVYDLSLVDLKSCGFLAFRDYITNYAESNYFTSLLTEIKKLKTDLSLIKYCLHIKENKVRVRKYEAEINYSTEVEKTFEKFKEGAVKDYRVEIRTGIGMNHVGAQILNFIGQLYPDIFSNLDNYYAKNNNFMNELIVVFDREIQFYIAYLEHMAIFKQAGLKFCYPQVSNTCKEVYNYEGFDLALAHKLIKEDSSNVCNDFYLKGKERIFVVTGPNQGGKTTFARTFGQLHYLASLGCPVPGREAQLFLFDRLFTHFEREENIKDLRGKLEDDLFRTYNILRQATSNSIIIMNEILTSTTAKDAAFLGRKVIEKIIQMDALSVCVTFVDELAYLGEKIVSMVAMVDSENPSLRTYKIVRKPADGIAYAISIAEKYQLTYERLKERIKL